MPCARTAPARAQPSLAESGARSAQEADDVARVERELSELRSAVERARFETAHALASTLLARPQLSARQRNDALELLAIAQIAAREEAAAYATLRELFARDPEHPQRLRDPGPSVEAAFARTRAERRKTLRVPIASAVVRDAHGRALAEVRLGPGREAVASVHVFARPSHAFEVTHLVAEVGAREAVTLALPPPAAGERTLELYVEARAPSGSVIGREGSREAPLVLQVAAPALCAAGPSARPLRRAWWLWTSVAIVVAGMGVSGALAAH